ncbi:MAG: sigma-70 family RNA polymerase sigma factor [Verrucomicrobiae bacterium]|nr:sigma-70 family RNA polymerase sigma factor [Verrucomicrobiae bacterium]
MAEDRIEPGAATFATTHWSAVVAAGDLASERCRAALDGLCRAYWFPLYAFLRRKGLSPEEAQDLTQSFLADFLARNQLSRADRTLGRFRSFLLASIENFLHNERRRRSAQKRGGGQLPISLDTVSAEARFGAGAAEPETPATAYDRHWARALIERVMERLQGEWEAQGRGALFHEFHQHLWGDATSVPYAELCARFDLTPVNLRVTFHRFRQRYRELLRETVAETVATEAEVEDEVRFLMRVVSR